MDIHERIRQLVEEIYRYEGLPLYTEFTTPELEDSTIGSDQPWDPAEEIE